MRTPWHAHGCLAFVTLTIMAHTACAQPLGGSLAALQKAFEADSQRRKELFAGTIKPTPEDARIATATANWYVWRVTHVEQGQIVPIARTERDLAELVSNILRRNSRPGAPAANQEFLGMFGDSLVGSMRNVLERDELDAAIVMRAAMMLETMARLKQDAIGAYLLELIAKDKTHATVRLYALQGLKEFMPIASLHRGADWTSTKVVHRMVQDARYVDALAQFITRPINVQALTPEETRVLQFFRREAIASLGHAGAPAVVALKDPVKLTKACAEIAGKKTVQAEGLVAPTLLRVLASDLPLAPALQEKLEAVHGVCGMSFDTMPEYIPEVALYLVGRTLLEFVDEYNKDWVHFAAVGANKRQPTIAWKAEAARMEIELVGFAGSPQGKELDVLAAPILRSIRWHERPDAKQLIALNKLVPTLRPAENKAFRTIKTAPIALPN